MNSSSLSKSIANTPAISCEPSLIALMHQSKDSGLLSTFLMAEGGRFKYSQTDSNEKWGCSTETPVSQRIDSFCKSISGLAKSTIALDNKPQSILCSGVAIVEPKNLLTVMKSINELI